MKRLFGNLFLIVALVAASLAHAGISSNYNANGVSITGGTINGATVGATTPSTVKATTTNSTSAILLNGKILYSATNPTISSGFGTSPVLTGRNGTAHFKLQIGTGGTANTGTISMPTATNGWACTAAANPVYQANGVTLQSAGTASSVTFIYYGVTTGVPAAWLAGLQFDVFCTGY